MNNSYNLSLGKTILSWLIAMGVVSSSVSYVGATERIYSPQAASEHPTKLLFGDLHLHTSYSSDAGMVGASLGPDAAYRFARGERVISNFGQPVQIAQPLDFLAVTDHAENLGLAPMVVRSDPALLEAPWGRQVHDIYHNVDPIKAYELWMVSNKTGENPLKGFDEITRRAWNDLTAAAETYNDPGQFTALIGYEWTSAPNGSNLHRNIIFRDGKEIADSILPLSRYDTPDPEQLWNWMEAYETKTGGRLLAIPHNGNLSSGLMFSSLRLNGDPIDQAYALRRQRFEPLVETTQAKGDGEAHPFLSPDDEFADFETWDTGDFGATPHRKEMLPNEYSREALKRGLVYEETLGANPFRFGLIGSTDSHTALATAEEDNWFGKVAMFEPTVRERRFKEKVLGRIPASDGSDNVQTSADTGASGLTAVWAHENTRASIWDALYRKEVYATTGPRIQVRLFAGADFKPNDVYRSDFAEHGYANGVPMGGTLSGLAKAPSFIVRAQADANGAFLDRVQIIKLWVDANDQGQEKVFDIAVAGDRKIDANGRAKAEVGNTVNVESATFDNSIGEAVLFAHWQDPEFNPDQHAAYYVRVLQIPTPRWTTRDAMFFNEPLPEGVPTAIQERAYSSPVWVNPR